MDKESKLPSYVKISIFFIGLYALITMLYISQGIVVPLIFSTIIAIVLLPIVDFFVRLKINRVFAIFITLFLSFLVVGGLVAILFSQAVKFYQFWPILLEKFSNLIAQTITWTASSFDINPESIQTWIEKTKGDFINTNTNAIGRVLTTLGNAILVVLLIPVYIFMILFYHPLLLEFIHRIFGKKNQMQVNEIVSQTKTVVQHYLVGLTIEVIIVAILNSAALLILGIDYAILLGIIGGILNIIPYIGGIVGVVLPMMVALITKSTAWYALSVMAIYYFIQLIDNNYIVPKIVASRVKINALFSIIVVIAGNALWGVSGMFLSIPLLAIIKLIFDNIESLKPWGMLLGDSMPKILNEKNKK